jgi:hypothetical protein
MTQEDRIELMLLKQERLLCAVAKGQLALLSLGHRAASTREEREELVRAIVNVQPHWGEK